MRADILLGPDIIDEIIHGSPTFELDIEVNEELMMPLSRNDLITNGCEITSISQDPHYKKLYHVVTQPDNTSVVDYCSAVKSIEVPKNSILDLLGNPNKNSSSFVWVYKPCAPSLRYEIGNDDRVYVFANESIDLQHAALTCNATMNVSCDIHRAKMFGEVGAVVKNLETHNDTCFSFEMETWYEVFESKRARVHHSDHIETRSRNMSKYYRSPRVFFYFSIL